MPTKRAASTAALLLLFIGSGVWVGRDFFRQWQARRAHAAADAFLRQGDFRSAFLTARQALQTNPNDATACRILAQIADATRSPAGVMWRQRLSELSPDDPAVLLDLATSATRAGEVYVADQALQKIPAHDRNSVTYHRAMAAWAISTRQFSKAEEHYRAATELSPSDISLQIDLASVQLTADSGPINEVRQRLEFYRSKPEYFLPASRALLADARRSRDPQRALNLAEDIVRHPAASIEDRLSYLQELQHAHSEKLDPELQKLATTWTGNVRATYALFTWMNSHGLAPRTLKLAERLRSEIRLAQPVPLAIGEALVIQGDWRGLRDAVADADWEDLEFLRFAMYARATAELSGSRRDPDFQLRWQRALNSTRGDSHAMSILARLVSGWGWHDEAAQAWWPVAAGSTGQRPALQALFHIYSGQKNTRELYRVARRILQLEPQNPAAKNNVASLALLLGEDLTEAHQLANELHQLPVREPAFISTYAHSLLHLKRGTEGLAELSTLPPSAWEDPSITLCFGLLLADASRTEEARKPLEFALRNPDQLFPEEVALAKKALSLP